MPGLKAFLKPKRKVKYIRYSKVRSIVREGRKFQPKARSFDLRQNPIEDEYVPVRSKTPKKNNLVQSSMKFSPIPPQISSGNYISGIPYIDIHSRHHKFRDVDSSRFLDGLFK